MIRFPDITTKEARAIKDAAPAYAADYNPAMKAVWLLIDELQAQNAKREQEIEQLSEKLASMNHRLANLQVHAHQTLEKRLTALEDGRLTATAKWPQVPVPAPVDCGQTGIPKGNTVNNTLRGDEGPGHFPEDEVEVHF